MNKEAILKFIKKYYNTKILGKYNINLGFPDLKILGKNVIADVEFPDDINLDSDEISKLWDDLYNINKFVSVLGEDINSVNFNPIFKYIDDLEDES